ncbi:MAG: response regulator [Anaerolineaceae bacterium]|nr:response regulator [Anaerolineaceae bacterium]
MGRLDELSQENEALRDRLNALSEASLRINESLDFDTVLQEVLDSARTLTDARYGVITLMNTDSEIIDYLFSGITSEEISNFVEMPEGPGLFGHLGRISEPLRIRDLQSHISAIGFADIQLLSTGQSPITFLAAPVLHRGEHVGTIFLADRKDGREFTREDEKSLLMFASQAAMVIANARQYRDERRARADLETLINMSPVGVAVLDVQTGTATTFNREAARLVNVLRVPDQPLEHLLEILTFRRADGREVSLQDFPLSQTLLDAETLRAEEIVLTVPDGRSLSALMNATPIYSQDGAVETYIVTLQDMTPLEEHERLRAEFLAMVSHELRTPLTSVKGSVATLLDANTALSPVETLQLHRIIDSQTDRMRMLISDLLDVAHIETGTLSVSPEPANLAILIDEASQAFQSNMDKHNICINLSPDLPWVMADRLRVIQVLGNLLTNAARNSPAMSAVNVSAERYDLHVAVSVSDAGRGIPAESLPHLFRKFSRIGGEEQSGDSGLGLAICKGIVEAHGGRIWASSDGPGLGARFTFTLPAFEVTGNVSPFASPQTSTAPSSAGGGERIRILAVDDDPLTLGYIRDTLARSGHDPVVTGDPMEVLQLMQENPRLVLLDLKLPGIDGIELMEEIHKGYDVPVIFLSAYGQDEHIARAFDKGASDYVVKPFSPTELDARIRAAIRKLEATNQPESYTCADLKIDFNERRVTLAGRPIRLTAIEYRTLAELSANSGKVLTYAQLLKRIWGENSYGDVRPMRTVISTIRRRLGDNAANPLYIFTEPRVGYRMAKSESQDAEQE